MMNATAKLLVHVLAVCLICLAMPFAARADCSMTPASNASFGTITSFAAAAQVQSTSTTNSGLTCSGSLLTLATGSRIDGTISSLQGGVLAGMGGDSITYGIFADQNHIIQLNLNQTYNWTSAQLLGLLGIFNGPATSLPLYFQTVAGSNVAAGTYTDTLTIAWDWDYCAGIGIGGICIGRDTGSGQSTFDIVLVVTNDCVIEAPDVDFGMSPTVGGFGPVGGSISLLCTKGMVYTVGLSAGNNPAPSGRRQMASGGNRLQYDIYSDAGTTVWGTATDRVPSDGAADGTGVQQLPYVAKIYTDQATPPIGTYTDSVIVDVRY